ncbi:polyprenyl synthetase family protein [Seonamhaeicola marinus]|uniref:Polyprenyl synthetase family protein n=1 Tax=Seonamhaeicola marinus TaxID=1912246 RepID=A0A5D0HSY4_9FLAO|nr:polyprenyl synthetase family protein [Seonamhaeicola marinus]TYA74483.1 polyprenyl synthetase family protein [Seonamhaeicola marinus]
MLSIEKYQQEFLDFLQNYSVEKEPKGLYAPINYILQLGGKRLRPVLALMTTDVFGGAYKKALNAALAIEVFHNFTLVHDDIMDDAPLRRGKSTVHEKWDVNTGILSGDAMLIMAYQLFEGYTPEVFKTLNQLFSKTALEVCEGQQYDVDFETRNDVTIPEYLKMIEYKTSVLVAAAMKMGAVIAGANKEDQEHIYEFGRNLGIAFQLQDDYLDAFGDPKTFGKQVGGDIIENKKTYLYLKALEFASKTDQERLVHLFNTNPSATDDKVTEVKQLFISTGSETATKQAVEVYTNRAFEVLEPLKVSENRKQLLRDFGNSLMRRNV